MRLRHASLMLAVLATACAVYWAWRQPAELAVAMSARPKAATASMAETALQGTGQGGVLRIKPRGGVADGASDAFQAAPWIESASVAVMIPAAAAEQPPNPQVLAPPLPFRLLGRYFEAGRPQGVFLQLNDQNLVVHEGDVVAEQYRVEGMDDTTLTLVHLPTGQRQTMNIGTAP